MSGLTNHALAADRKKPRPLKSDVKRQIPPTYANFDRICDIAYSICKKLGLPKVTILYPNSLGPDKRPKPVALDLPKSKYGGKISRDEWIARSIASVFKTNPNAKMLGVVGNNHALKKLDWRDHVLKKNGSIRQYLCKKRRNLRFFPIGQVIGESVYEGDFRREFGHIDGAVAVDLDERFAGWKLGIVESVAIKRGEVWELLDGVVIY